MAPNRLLKKRSNIFWQANLIFAPRNHFCRTNWSSGLSLPYLFDIQCLQQQSHRYLDMKLMIIDSPDINEQSLKNVIGPAFIVRHISCPFGMAT